ncbi:hypothetical protein G6F35_016003 [Rhizopus arrhizus]|nr:hypothetical protein G6F35_016003 [Rhizopus arrhizus]
MKRNGGHGARWALAALAGGGRRAGDGGGCAIAAGGDGKRRRRGAGGAHGGQAAADRARNPAVRHGDRTGADARAEPAKSGRRDAACHRHHGAALSVADHGVLRPRLQGGFVRTGRGAGADGQYGRVAARHGGVRTRRDPARREWPDAWRGQSGRHAPEAGTAIGPKRIWAAP